MHRFFTLLKILLINNLGISVFRTKASKNRIEYLKVLGLCTAIAVGIAPSIYLYIRLLIKGYNLLLPIGQAGAILTLGIVIVSVMIFFFGIFYIINVFYFAVDAQSLLALPLSGWQVLGARFSIVLCYEYLTELPFLLPPLLVFGIKSQASAIFYIYGLIGYLLVPLLPLAIATIPTVIIMKFANLGRRKDLFKILGGLLVIALAVAYQLVFQGSGNDVVDPQFLQKMLSDRNGLINLISRIFPSTKYLALALVNHTAWTGLLNLLIFTGLSLLALALAWLIGDKLYFGGLIGSSEATAKRKVLSSSDFRNRAKSSSALLTYFRKEMYLLFRTPSYFINCVLINILLPVIMVVPLLVQSHKGNLPLGDLMSSPSGQKIFLLGLVGLSVFLVSSNGIASTSLSREGKDFYISKYIPLNYKQQIWAKLLSAYILGMIGAIFLLAAARIVIPLNMLLVGRALLVTAIAIVPIIEAGLLMDIFNPKLDWDNEQKAVKQNLNVIFSMLFAIILAGCIIFTVYKFINSLGLASILMFLYFTITAIILYYFLITRGIARYRQLEG